MNPRLAALLRQRDLLREHAAWLDSEIAREQGAQSPTPIVAASNRIEVPAPSGAPTNTHALVPEPDIKELHSEVRQGCMLYFMIAASLLGALIGFIYWRY